MLTFEELNLGSILLGAVKMAGYEEPTSIQCQAIPQVLAGNDVLGCSQTGTGKTAAFALPILQKLSDAPRTNARWRPIRALILTPTRELAAQIGDCFSQYGRQTGLKHTVIYGGVNQRPQTMALDRGVDILIATPGRLLDLTNQGWIDYRSLEIFVLDEADRMLDMGFIVDVRKITEMIPEKRQTLFFSATMPPDIQRLADNILHDPVLVSITPPCTTVELIDQSIYFVEKMDKPLLLTDLLKGEDFGRVLIFTRTKYGADKVASHLVRCGVRAEAIHGNKTQNARQYALDLFKRGRIRALVATDIASRGIDVESITHVINYDLPNEAESYIHRIGRTGRAGLSGAAISFCDSSEREFLPVIERLIKQHIPRVEDHPCCSPFSSPPMTNLDPRSGQRFQGRGGNSYRRSYSTGRRGGYGGRR